jgi:hypothetical protein
VTGRSEVKQSLARRVSAAGVGHEHRKGKEAMRQIQVSRKVGVRSLAALMLLGMGLGSARAVDEAAETKKQLLELSGGKQVKVVWNQDKKVRLYDTKAGATEELPLPEEGSAPLISVDGRYVFTSAGKAPDGRAVFMYDTRKKKLTELAKGPGNNLLAIWRDPKTKKDWVYVNSTGDQGENWDQAKGGAINRFPVDKPEARELFWDRTSSHIYLMLSADGTRACFEPSWANIGQLKLAFTADGKVDQDKSEYKQYGGGCFPSMAPDNSYRLFRLEGDHHAITMQDADGENARKIPVSEMPGVKEKGRNTWLTRWSTHPRYITLVAPAGGDARIWIGRLDEAATKIEQWVPVTKEGGSQCWQSQAWVAE